MDFDKEFLGKNFVWWIGEVEDRNDPLKLGRVRVRCFGWHTTDKEVLPAKALPWANVVMPSTAPATSSSGLTRGVWVFGFFMDGSKAQRPVVIGHLPGYRFGSPGESELPRAARGEADYLPPGDVLRDSTVLEEVVVDPNDEQPDDTETGQVNKWAEPARPTDADYPTAMIQAHESGTYTQIAGSGRYTIQSNNGSYIEIDAGGNGKFKVVTDHYEIIGGSKYMDVKGTVNMHVVGNVVNNIEGNLVENITGNVTRNITGTLEEKVTGDVTYVNEAKRTETVTGDVTETYQATKTESVTGAVSQTYNASLSTAVSSDKSLSVGGGSSQSISGASTLSISGSQDITASVTNINNNVNVTGDVDISGTSTAAGDHVSAGKSGKSHTHTDTAGIGAGTTSPPN